MVDNWTKHEALMVRALSELPEKLEDRFLDTSDFRKYFRDFYGRPVQDIVEAVYQYGQDGYFKSEIMLEAEYLKRTNALDQVTQALNELQSDYTTNYRGLSESVHAKVIDKKPLTIAEVRGLPDRSRPYLVFKLSGIDRQRIRNELAIYNDDTFIQPSRLEKIKTTEQVSWIARVFMDGRSINIMVADQIYTIAKLSQDGSHYNFMRYLTDPNNSEFAISYEEISHIDGCGLIKSMSEHIRHCGFDSLLKKAFFAIKKDKLRNELQNKLIFLATANLDAKQYDAVKKQALKVENKS